jgi:Concanavalin A-like lectin/glucanases superfamily
MGRLYVGDVARYHATSDTAPKCDITGLSITESCWVKPSSIPDWMIPMGKGQFAHGATSGQSHFATCKQGGSEELGYGASLTPQIGKWTHLAHVRGPDSNQRVYTNGVQGGTWGSGLLMTTFSVAMFIGRESGGFPWYGDVADVALWNVGLTAKEVAALAQGVSPLLIRLGSLKSYWPMAGIANPEANLACSGTNVFQNGTANPKSTTNPPAQRWAPCAG